MPKRELFFSLWIVWRPSKWSALSDPSRTSISYRSRCVEPGLFFDSQLFALFFVVVIVVSMMSICLSISILVYVSMCFCLSSSRTCDSTMLHSCHGCYYHSSYDQPSLVSLLVL